MPRQKNVPDVVSRKMDLAHRLKEIRQELFGQRGGPELARRLNLPTRTWYNYEKGVTIPGEVLIDFLSLTQVPLERFAGPCTGTTELVSSESHLARLTIGPDDLLNEAGQGQPIPVRTVPEEPMGQMVVQTVDSSMQPSLPPGSLIGLGGAVEADQFPEVAGQIVVAWHMEMPVARRLAHAGQHWLLEADEAGWPTIVLTQETAESTKIQRVLWLLRPLKTEKRLILVQKES